MVDGSPLDIGGGHFLDVRRPKVNEFLFQFMQERGKRFISWILFCIGGLGAAYSHYFAFAASILIYGFVFVRLLIYDKKNIWKCAVATIVSICGYLPWIKTFVSEAVSKVTNGFWISGTVPIKDGFRYMFGNPRILYMYLLLLFCCVVYVYGIVNVGLDKERQLRITFFSGEMKDDSIAWMAISGALTVLMILVFEIVYGNVLIPIFSSTIISYFQANKATQTAVKQIDVYIDAAEASCLITDVEHFSWSVLGYYFPTASIEVADPEKQYHFSEDGIDNVLLLMNQELDDELLETYENHLGGVVEFVSDGSLAGYHYFLYRVVF